ncbi:MAG: hypothetical protein OXQ89_00410 [Rhodospirillaceae bacterium]|nr:hypothetical protein [Rhodospirillaceae bacterium]
MRQRLGNRNSFPFGIAGVVLLSGLAAAEAQVLAVSSEEGRVIVMPGGSSTMAGTMVDGVNVSVGVEGDFRVYRAVFRGETHVAHVALEGPAQHLAFDPVQARFRQVLPSLLIELVDYARLDDVVEAIGGVSGKSYEQLGFAIVRLPETVNPGEAAQALQGHAAVIAVQVQLDRPLNVPL